MEKRAIGNFCNTRFSMIGYPDDLGVKNVNGRLGAALGPEKFFEYFRKLNGKMPLLPGSFSETQVKMGPDLEANYHRAIEATEDQVRALTFRTDLLIVIGGGHDYAYPWIRGVVSALNKKNRIGCINIDAHFDLRPHEPVMTSGSPFRRLIEEKWLDPKNLIEFGIQNHCNHESLWTYADSKKIKTVPFETLRNGKAVPEFKRCLQALKKKVDCILISVDLDALSLAYAPGVSAPQAEGFSASELFQMLELAGAEPKVFSTGFFELAPPLDVQDHTSRLAAKAAYQFIYSKSKRKGRRA